MVRSMPFSIRTSTITYNGLLFLFQLQVEICGCQWPWVPQRTFDDILIRGFWAAESTLNNLPGPAPTPVLSTALIRGRTEDDDEEEVTGSLPVVDIREPMSVPGIGGGPISWDVRLEEAVELCTERKALRGEGGTEFKSGAMTL